MSHETLRKHASTFHFASLCLSAKDCDAAASLYAICRTVDDIADQSDSPEKSHNVLLQLEHAIRQDNEADALAKKFYAIQPAVDKEVFIELIRGVRSDTQLVRVRSEEELLRYCYRVAGTVGLMMCDVFGVKDAGARAHAIDLGIAMQLTNIARDVVEDAENGRRYLPESWVGNLSPWQILSPTDVQREAIAQAVQRTLELAEAHYASGFRGLPYLAMRSRFAILVAGRLYRRIGHKIAARDHDVWNGRVFTTRFEKGMELLRACVSYLPTCLVSASAIQHDMGLHQGLERLPYAHSKAQ
jgi:phytoene synthase